MEDRPTVANRGPITVSIMLATLMNTLDSTIANVALPHIQGSLSASPEQITWVLTSYMVAMAVTMPLSGWLAGRFGVKWTFLVTIGGFTTASMLCGIADNLPQIVAFRFLQGMFGASTIPLSQAVLLNINPPERHPQAMALWAMGTILGPILGPVVGGYLTEAYSWRWCFLINLPIGILAMLGVAIFMAGSREAQRRRFDFLGFGVLAVSVAALQLMLDRGPSLDWFSSPEICAEALVSVIGLWVFVAHSVSTPHPFFDPGLFRDRNLMAATLFSMLTGVLIFASLAILPLLMQSLMGYPPLTAGLLSAPRGVTMFVSTYLMGRLTKFVDHRLSLLLGLVCMAVALWMMGNFDLSMDSGPLLLSALLQGVATGVLFVALTTLAFATIDQRLRPEATAFYNLTRNIAASVGISGMQALVAFNTQTMHASLASQVIPSDAAVRAGLPLALDPQTAAGALALNSEITRQATMVAYVDDFRLMLLFTLICAPLLLLLRPPKVRMLAEPMHAGVD